MQLDTYRYHGHHVGDINREYYRPKTEEELWKTERDPIKNFGSWLLKEKVLTEAEISQIDKDVQQAAKDAVTYAEAAEYPDVSEVTLHVYKQNQGEGASQ